MNDPKKIRDWAIKRIQYCIQQAQVEDDSFDIETRLYSIMRIAENAQAKLRELNRGCDHE